MSKKIKQSKKRKPAALRKKFSSKQKTIEQKVTKEKAVKQIQAIYRDFLAKIEKIRETRDKKIFALIKKAEERQIATIRKEIK